MLRGKIFRLSCVLFLFLSVGLTPGAEADMEVKAWHDPAFDFYALRKLFILPFAMDLRVEGNNGPQQDPDLVNAIVTTTRSALSKNRPLVKPFDLLLEDFAFLHIHVPQDVEAQVWTDGALRGKIFRQAAELKYQAAIEASTVQTVEVEHIPEQTRTYTEYKEVNIYDRYGNWTGTMEIPEEKVEVIPAHDEHYLWTSCTMRLYDVSALDEKHKAEVNVSNYEPYEGASPYRVVGDLIKTASKQLFPKRK